MKTFTEIREKRKKGMPPGEHIFDTKIKGIHVMVHKEKNKFVTYVDIINLTKNGVIVDIMVNIRSIAIVGYLFQNDFISNGSYTFGNLCSSLDTFCE